MTLSELIFLILIFCVVLALAYYSTRLIAGAKLKNMKKGNMQIVETIAIGTSHLHILKVYERYFLITSQKDGIRILSEIDYPKVQENKGEGL